MFRLIIIFFFISSSILGQGYGPNRVINPSFEEVVACPFQLGQIAFASPWGSYGVTADLYSTCAGANCPNFTAPYVCVPTNTYGTENPIRGENYAGCFFAKDGDIGRSYLVSQLQWPLVQGKTYRVKFFVSLAEESNVAIDQIGAFFSENRVEAGPSTQIYAEPQVRSDSIINQQNGWTEIQNEFIADGNERFLTIGAFISATSTQYEVVNDTSGGIMSYYYIDSVAVQQYYPPQPGGPPNRSICEGQSTTLTARNTTKHDWALDSSPGVIFSSDLSITVTPATTTTYILYHDSGSVKITVSVIHPGDFDINLGPDLKLCERDDSVLVGVSPNQAYKYKSYLWSDGTTDDTTKHNGSGWYWFQAVDVCNNVYRDSIYVEVVLLPILDLGPDTVMCYGDTLNYDISFPASNYLWENGSVSPLRTIVNSGNYWAEITNFCERISDTVNVTVLNSPNQVLGPDTVFCQGDSVTFDVTSAYSTFLWDDSSTSPIRNVSLPGMYWVELSNKCGKSIDTIRIGTIDSVSLELGLDSIICSGDTLTFDATFPFSNYLWDDGSTLPIREIWSGGIYFVQVQNVCNIAYDTLDLEVVDCFCDMYISNAFTPDGDGLNEVYGPITYCKPVEYLFQIYSRWGNILFESTDYLAKWDGVTNGRMAINDEFVYRLTFRFKHQTEPVTKIGGVTVVRKKLN